MGQAWGSPALAWVHWACVCMLVCLYRPLTVNFKQAHWNISRRSILRACTVRVQHPRQCRGKTTEVEARMQLVYVFFISCLNYGLWKANFTVDYLRMVTMQVASGINSRDSAHNLLSSCMCSHSSCPDWQQAVTYLVAISVLCAMIIASTMCCLLRLAPRCWNVFLPLYLYVILCFL